MTIDVETVQKIVNESEARAKEILDGWPWRCRGKAAGRGTESLVQLRIEVSPRMQPDKTLVVVYAETVDDTRAEIVARLSPEDTLALGSILLAVGAELSRRAGK